MSRIFALTKVGRKALRDGSADEEELKILEYLGENRSASEDQLEVAGGERYLLRGMKSGGLVRELTT